MTTREVNPMNPEPTWKPARPERRKARIEDKLADAIDRELIARRRMRRAFRAWEKADAALDRLNRKLEKGDV